MKKTLSIVSGYFNPLHKGHLEYFNKSKALGDELIVIINNDKQRLLKGSCKFYDEQERMMIVSSLKMVDHIFLSIDEDRTVRKSIKQVYNTFNEHYKLIFTNGGDQFFDNSPEKKLCDKLDIKVFDGLGDKIQSSSWLLS